MSSFLHLLSIFLIILFSRASNNNDSICNDENKADQLSTQQEKPNEAIKRTSWLKDQYEKLYPLFKQTSPAVSQSKQESHPTETSSKKLLSKDEEKTNTPQIDNNISQEPAQTQQTSSNKSHELPSTKRKFWSSFPSKFKFGKQSSESKTTNIENPNTCKNNEFNDTLSPTTPSLEKGQDDSEDIKLDDQEKKLTTTDKALLPKTSLLENKPSSTSNYKQTYMKNIDKMNNPNNFKHNDQALITDREFEFDEIRSKLEDNKHYDQDNTQSEQTTTLNLNDISSESNTEIISTPSTHDPRPRSPSTHDPRPRSPSTHDPRPRSPSTHDPRPRSPNTHDPRPRSPSTHDPRPRSPSTHDPRPRSPNTHRVKASTPPKGDSSSRYYLIIGVVIISILILISIVFFLYFKKIKSFISLFCNGMFDFMSHVYNVLSQNFSR